MASRDGKIPTTSVRRRISLFNRSWVRAAQHRADLHVVVQERDELSPCVLPQPDDRPVPLTPFLSQVVERGPGRRGVHGGIDGLQIALGASQSRLEASRKVLRIRWTLCRRRHNAHYADLRVMPTWRRELVAAACRSMMSRITNRSCQARAFKPTASSSDRARTLAPGARTGPWPLPTAFRNRLTRRPVARARRSPATPRGSQ